MTWPFDWSRGSRVLLAGAIPLGIVIITFSIVSATDPTPGSGSSATLAAVKVREAAVAGLFYPKDPGALSNAVDRYLAAAHPTPVENLKALVCPHAGYEYSGPVAAMGYRLLEGREYDTVVIMAPSHYAAFRGAAVSTADVFETPLGTVPISPLAKKLAGKPPFMPESPAYVQRPGWWVQSSRTAPARGEETADTWEHSDEVQVPFLQRTLGSFSVLPIVFGDTDPKAAAAVLKDYTDDRTLWIVSSDLSHFHSYEEARRLDGQCAAAVCDLDIERMEDMEACGRTPILTLMHLARMKGWRPRLLDYRNSGDTAGDKSRVVGYMAIAFYEPLVRPKAHSEEERALLLRLARESLAAAARGGEPPTPNAADYPEGLRARKACFVTLTKQGQLRGCIGHIFPTEPLYQAVIDNARNAALYDPRFTRVTEDELAAIRIEISVLSEPVPLVFDGPAALLERLRPGIDGVVLQMGSRRATYLPQVWEQLPDKVAFLESLSRKAGCPADEWRHPGTTVSTYQAELFHETP